MPFRPGVSGNPSGRPKVAAEVRDLARKHTAKAIATLVACLEHPDGRTRVAAANSILDRGYGRPEQPIMADIHVQHSVAELLTEARQRGRMLLEHGAPLTIDGEREPVSNEIVA